VTPLRGLDVKRVQGLWYPIKQASAGETSASNNWAVNFDCFEERFSQNPSNDYVLDYQLKYYHKTARNMSIINGFLTIDPKEPAVMNMYFFNTVHDSVIIATDYNGWLLVQGTTVVKATGKSETTYYILSRSQSLDPTVLSVIEKFINVPSRNFVSYSYKNCPKPVQVTPPRSVGVGVMSMGNTILPIANPRCPTFEMSDCAYEDCSNDGCSDEKICCPKPCGGTWCVAPVDTN